MPTDDVPVEFAKELARQLPAKELYADAIAPPAREAGQIGGDLLKALQLALAPVQLLAAYQDRYRKFLDESVRRVSEDKRIAPAPQIIGPILEGIRYEAAETPIDRMFSELLSRAMDCDRVDEAHPSFPLLIKQLSSDEAKLLVALKDRSYRVEFTQEFDSTARLFGRPHFEMDNRPRDLLTFPGKLDFYVEHLFQLGLAGMHQVGNQEPIWEGAVGKKQTGIRVTQDFQLMVVGRAFVEACTGSG